MLGDVLDADGVLDGQAVGLAFDPSSVDQNTAIRSETYPSDQLMSPGNWTGMGYPDQRHTGRSSLLTGKCHADVIVQHSDFPDRPRIL
jgi:hypothetical protein